MSAGVLGAALGLLGGCGLWLVAIRVLAMRRTSLDLRVLPYLRDLAAVRPVAASPVLGERSARTLVAALLRSAADGVERVLGGSVSVRRRLDRAGLADRTVHDFRVEQVLWGVLGFALTAGAGVLRFFTAPTALMPLALLCLVGFGAGVIARDQRLSSQVKARERRMVAEFPTVAELLALSVAAGEGPVAALDRVVRRSGGELSTELGRVLGEIRTGEPIAVAFDRLAARSGLSVVSRFAQGLAVAVERGTPLADVLHAQAADVREAGRRELIESAARREIVMLIPVVFLVLPVTVLFAFWPGLVGLSLTAP